MASDTPLIGTMVPFGGTFTIQSYAQCSGGLLPISQNQALFSLIGDYYGGDARTSMGLPDLRGRSPVGMGQMPGGNTYQLGLKAGQETTTLSLSQLPTHSHTATFTPSGPSQVTGTLQAATNGANEVTPDSDTYLGATATNTYFKPGGLQPTNLTEIAGLTVAGGAGGGTVTVDATGSSSAVDILNPLQVVNWQIALEGLYPSRN